MPQFSHVPGTQAKGCIFAIKWFLWLNVVVRNYLRHTFIDWSRAWSSKAGVQLRQGNRTEGLIQSRIVCISNFLRRPALVFHCRLPSSSSTWWENSCCINGVGYYGCGVAPHLVFFFLGLPCVAAESDQYLLQRVEDGAVSGEAGEREEIAMPEAGREGRSDGSHIARVDVRGRSSRGCGNGPQNGPAWDGQVRGAQRCNLRDAKQEERNGVDIDEERGARRREEALQAERNRQGSSGVDQDASSSRWRCGVRSEAQGLVYQDQQEGEKVSHQHCSSVCHR